MAERNLIRGLNPIIISGKSKSGVLAGRWQMLCYKVLSYQHRPMSGTPKQQNEALQTTFQSTKTIRGLPKGVWPTFEKSKILTIFTQPKSCVVLLGVPRPSKINSRHFQMTNTTYNDDVSINQSHQGPPNNILAKVIFWRFSLSPMGWWVGRWSMGNFPEMPRN